MFSPSDFARVAVVGTSGSGKSTFARTLASRLAANHIELDAIYWGPNWTPVPEPEFRQQLDSLTSQPRWVCDGNYRIARDLVWQRATTVIWLNYSVATVFGHALARTIRRCARQEPLFGGNRETFRKSFFSSDSILVWILRTHWRHQREYPREFAEPDHRHLQVIELRREADARRLLDAVGDWAAAKGAKDGSVAANNGHGRK